MTDCERRGGDNHAILEQIRSAPADGGILYIVLHNIDGPGQICLHSNTANLEFLSMRLLGA